MAATRSTKSLNFPSFCMGDLSYVDIQEYLKHSDTILIPKASLEQHGPHLPLYCDTITATEVATRAGEQAGIMYTPPRRYLSQPTLRHWTQLGSSRLQTPNFREWTRLERESG